MEEEEDRMSQLPDDILLLILDKMDIFEAVETTILSNRWKNLWRYLPRLRFSLPAGGVPFEEFKPQIRSYCQRVSQFLSHRDAAAAVHDFHLSFDNRILLCSGVDREFVEECVVYAINHGVQSLRIHGPTYHKLRLPAAFLACKTLRELDLRDFGRPVKVPGHLSLPNLKTFHLETRLVFDDDHHRTEPFSGLPELEKLTLVGSTSDAPVVINSSKLRVLEIDY